jgi:PAS domain S-box-containing protein
MHDVAGKRMLEFVTEIEEHWLVNYGKVAMTGEPVRFANEYKSLDRWFDVYAFKIGEPESRRVAVLFTDITERKRADEARARLAAIVESSDDAIVSKDLNGVITSWNAGSERLFGYTAQEAIGQSVTMLIPRERLDEEPDILNRIRHGESVEHHETVRRRKDGTLFDVSLTVSPIMDSLGNVVGASKIARNITERKQAEEALRASEEDFRTLFASAPMAAFACDRNAVIQRYNLRAAELWGREPVCGVERYSGAVKLWFPNGTPLPHAQSPVVDVLRTGIPALDVEVYIERPDGSRLPVLANFSALKNARGEVTGAITSFMDVSERKQAEEVRRSIMARFQVLADNMPALCWMANADGWIFWYNRRWYEYTGTTPETQEGWGWESVHDPEILPAVMERWKASIATGQPFEMVFPLKGADGVFHPFLTRIVPLRDKGGQVAQWFGTSTDITNERKAEDRQRLLTNELAHRGKNLLAVIQSIAFRSLSGTRPLTEARDVLIQRLHALARSQSVLLTEGFEGAPLTEVVRLEFEAFSERVKVIGPDVMLNPGATQTFALLVHELATNAIKHGALSRSGGQIAIHWSIEGADAEARFRFQWQERDGPTVVPPTREGFGRILLEKAVAQEFGAPPKIKFAPEGLSYEIDAPLSLVAAESWGGRQYLSEAQE